MVSLDTSPPTHISFSHTPPFICEIMTEPKAEEWWLDDSLPTGAPEEQVPDVSDIFVYGKDVMMNREQTRVEKIKPRCVYRLSELDRSSETNPILTDAFFDVEYVDGKSVFLDTLLAESAGSETEPALLPSEVFNTHMGGGTIPTTLGVAQITAVITATLETLETPFMYKERDLKVSVCCLLACVLVLKGP